MKPRVRFNFGVLSAPNSFLDVLQYLREELDKEALELSERLERLEVEAIRGEQRILQLSASTELPTVLNELDRDRMLAREWSTILNQAFSFFGDAEASGIILDQLSSMCNSAREASSRVTRLFRELQGSERVDAIRQWCTQDMHRVEADIKRVRFEQERNRTNRKLLDYVEKHSGNDITINFGAIPRPPQPEPPELVDGGGDHEPYPDTFTIDFEEQEPPRHYPGGGAATTARRPAPVRRSPSPTGRDPASPLAAGFGRGGGFSIGLSDSGGGLTGGGPPTPSEGRGEREDPVVVSNEPLGPPTVADLARRAHNDYQHRRLDLWNRNLWESYANLHLLTANTAASGNSPGPAEGGADGQPDRTGPRPNSAEPRDSGGSPHPGGSPSRRQLTNSLRDAINRIYRSALITEGEEFETQTSTRHRE